VKLRRRLRPSSSNSNKLPMLPETEFCRDLKPIEKAAREMGEVLTSTIPEASPGIIGKAKVTADLRARLVERIKITMADTILSISNFISGLVLIVSLPRLTRRHPRNARRTSMLNLRHLMEHQVLRIRSLEGCIRSFAPLRISSRDLQMGKSWKIHSSRRLEPRNRLGGS